LETSNLLNEAELRTAERRHYGIQTMKAKTNLIGKQLLALAFQAFLCFQATSTSKSLIAVSLSLIDWSLFFISSMRSSNDVLPYPHAFILSLISKMSSLTNETPNLQNPPHQIHSQIEYKLPQGILMVIFVSDLIVDVLEVLR
jgi:hypothetical protein